MSAQSLAPLKSELRSLRNRIKSSTASVIPLASASITSKSPSDAHSNLLNIVCSRDSPQFPAYSIEHLTSGRCRQGNNVHSETIRIMKGWLESNLSQPNFSVTTGHPQMKQHRPVFTKITKVPDLVIKKNGIVMVQFEIESDSDRISTLRKLGYGLMHQLIYLRNNHNVIAKIYGFFIPRGQEPAYVEKVSCKWIDIRMKFHVEPDILGEDQVLPTIRDICNNCNYSFTNDATTFLVPLTLSFVRSTFGEHAYQVN